MPKMTPELTVALPAYLEADNLAILLPELRSALDQLGVDYEILVVDTQVPRDTTPEVCSRNDVTCLARRHGDLYSHAIETAIRASRGTWLVFMDADGSHDPSFVAELWRHRHDADLVIASRYVPGGETENPRILIFLSRVVNLTFRLVLGLQCADVSNSFRLYRGDDIRSLTLTCENFDIVEEILIKLVAPNPGYRVREIPFTFRKRAHGESKRRLVAFAFGYLATLWKLNRMVRRERTGVTR
jgi:dolichol-phosphate mannosyltransferase